MRRIFFLLIAFISLLYSCRSTRKIQTAIVKKDTAIAAPVVRDHSGDDSLNFIQSHFDSVWSNRIDFTTFTGKIDVEYTDDEGKRYNVNAHIRMYKDSAIWVSITAILGIEGLRAYITRDSVKLLDKQKKIYTARSLSYLQEVTALPLDLYSLQDLLIGNPVFLDPNIVSYTRGSGSISLLSIGSFFKNLFTIQEDTKWVISSKLDDLEETRNRTCYLSYSDYENKKGFNFSRNRTIHVTESKKLDVKLDFKQYDFNETLSFPFSIPKNYTRN